LTVADPLRIVVLTGDETGAELLEQALRVLDPDVLGLEVELERHDLSLARRRATRNDVVREAAAALRRVGAGVKAPTVNPPDPGDVGSANHILRDAIDAKVIVRSGRPLPGVAPLVAGLAHPIAVVRMAVGDTYEAEQWREAEPPDEIAFRVDRITRSLCTAVAEYAFRLAAANGATVLGGPKWTASPVYEALLKDELDAASARHPNVPYEPLLIDVLYGAVLTRAREGPVVVPALNRDGDCLSQLVLTLFGSVAGSESLLLGLDEEFAPGVVLAEAPHGTAPDLAGRNVANPIAMLLACGSALRHAARRAGDAEAEQRADAIAAAVQDTCADGVRTRDLGGRAGTSEVVDAVVGRLGSPLRSW
jgi:isocitrate dehydrogenase (NAD+)